MWLRVGSSRMPVAFVALGAMAGTLAVAKPAGAEAKFAFSWRAASDNACLTEEKVRAALEKKLRRSVFSSLDEADIAIEGEELRDAHRYRARITQRDRAGRELGSRELTAETCGALERMTVVLIALVLEPGGAASATDGERPPENPESEEPAGKPLPVAPHEDGRLASADTSRRPSSPPLVAQPARPRRVELHAGVGMGAATGMLPRVSASVRLTTRLTVHGSRLSADWSAGVSLPQSVTEDAVRATFTLVDQQVRGCWAWFDRPSSRIDTCAGGFFSALVPTGDNLDNRNGSALSLFGPTASLALRLKETPATVHVELGVLAPTSRYNVTYLARSGEERTLYATPPLMAMATVAGTFRVF
ncbi:hypothetical protein AKJ09_11031 [Labilithrix luteola]|uniref:Uncharacterized protein n=1 Tax=Labilithrix luteola TaxID=1391654 RepID=A0A0K1QF68_9BACT|nr:hypothetical protein [Labilithrix luteola]AKV04368.1 hypothetical protein AKJ09_11031 [Labilithrix luteola]